MKPKIGFVGAGIMGAGMVQNLHHGGHGPSVWNRSKEKLTPLAAAGLAVADSLETLAASSQVLFLCLGDTPDVEEVGAVAISYLSEGAIVVDHSTISPRATREIAVRAEQRGVTWIDAPVSGGSEGARDGTLSMMVGGPAEKVAIVRELLDSMAASVVHVGPVGAGQTTKLVNQILVVVNQLAVSEALLFATESGLSLDTTIDAVNGGAAGSWMLANRGPQMAAGYWEPGFTIDLQQKDLRLVTEAALELGLDLAGTSLTQRLYSKLQERGLGSEGNHALIKALVDEGDGPFA